MSHITQLTQPDSLDGLQINQLIARCPPLDVNSTYCNLLQCDHFSSTSVIAKAGKLATGFISAYRIPQRKNTLFIWQVAVDQNYRGTGLATKMLNAILKRTELADIDFIETTITLENKASWALFTRFANSLKAELSKVEYYTSNQHFKGEHDSEWLVRIGPFVTPDTGDQDENL